MDIGFSSYHNGGPVREQDFERLSQTVGTSILKISQNGNFIFLFINFTVKKFIIIRYTFFISVINAKNG